MANQYFEVITLLDSDDESESKVEAAGNSVRSQKKTARKSVRSGMTVTSIKKEPPLTVPQPPVLDGRNANQTTSLNSTENFTPSHKTARKSLKTSNVPTTTRMVTSPKLSLKRRRIEDAQNSSEKKQKMDSAVQSVNPNQKSNSIHSDLTPQQTDPNKAIPLPYVKTISTTDAAQQVDRNKVIALPFIETVSSTTDAAQQADPNKAIPMSYAQLNTTPAQLSGFCKQNNVSENSLPWSSTDDNATKFKKLLEFSKTFMTATNTEKCTIIKNFHKLLDKANPTYVNSKEFHLLLNDTLKKIKESKDTFVQLQTIKTELKAYKRKKALDQSLNSSHLSSELPETTKFASNLGLFPSKPPKIVPEPIRAEHLASAILSVTSNLNSHDDINNSSLLSNVPSTSKQADIVENFRLSMPASNTGTSANEFWQIPSTSKQAHVIDNLHLPLLVVNSATSVNDLQSVSKQEDVPFVQCNKYLNDKVSGLEKKLSAPDQADPPKEMLKLNNHIAHSKNGIFHEKAMQNESVLVNGDSVLVENPQGLHQRERDPFVNAISKEVSDEKSLNSSKVKHATSLKNPESIEEKFEKRVKFLENYLAQLDRKIKKLQSKELTLDDLDDEDSTYILEDRYKKKFQKTWVTLCRIKKRSHLVGREIERRFTYNGSRHDAINKSIEKLINKRKIIEKFPNYGEVLNLIQKISSETHLSLTTYEVESEAREAFENIGIELKRRRQADEERDFGCYLTDNINLEPDPAEFDEELNKKLSCSVVEGEKKIKEIIDKYASEQREKAPGDESAEEEGSDCEGPHNDEPMEEDPQKDSMGEENPIGGDDLPDTDPATPETDERAASPEIVPNSTITVPAPVQPADVIELGSSSDASTEPARSPPNTTFIESERIFIDDEIEIVEDNQLGDSGSSVELPSISELCR